MRGNHNEYIAAVNAQTERWYIPVEKNIVESIIPMRYYLPDGLYEIPAGTRSDLFSVVPDTDYIEFHKSAFLHDDIRKKGVLSREVADFCFSWDMMKRIEHIRRLLLATDCDRKVIDREVVRLMRVAAIYTIGVSGAIGSLYIKLDKWF